MDRPPTQSAPAPLASEMLAHRYDADHDAIHYIVANRALRSRVAFLTDELLMPTSPPTILSRRDALARSGPSSPIHFIFHSAYCCSTLLAKGFDVVGVASTLKEPQMLNDLVGWRHRGAKPDTVLSVLDDCLSLLGQPFESDESVIIKPSNVTNGLMTAMMTVRPEARAILLYAPLRTYLASLARKGMWGRLWARELFSRQMVDGLIDLGFQPRDHILHTDLQVAAVGWLAQQKLFASIAARWPDRVVTLDSEALVARPDTCLARAAAHYGLSMHGEQISAIVASVFSKNSKDDTAFAAGQRDADRMASENIHAEEIDKVAIWAAEVAHSAHVPMALGRALLD